MNLVMASFTAIVHRNAQYETRKNILSNTLWTVDLTRHCGRAWSMLGLGVVFHSQVGWGSFGFYWFYLLSLNVVEANDGRNLIDEFPNSRRLNLSLWFAFASLSLCKVSFNFSQELLWKLWPTCYATCKHTHTHTHTVKGKSYKIRFSIMNLKQFH